MKKKLWCVMCNNGMSESRRIEKEKKYLMLMQWRRGRRREKLKMASSVYGMFFLTNSLTPVFVFAWIWISFIDSIQTGLDRVEFASFLLGDPLTLLIIFVFLQRKKVFFSFDQLKCKQRKIMKRKNSKKRW